MDGNQPIDLLERATEALQNAGTESVPPMGSVARLLAIPSKYSARPRWFAYAAAMVVIGVGAGVLMLVLRTGGVAMGDVIDKIAKTHTFTAAVDDARISVKDRSMRFERGAMIEIWNQESGKLLFLNPAERTAQIMQLAQQKYDLYQFIHDYHDGHAKSLGHKNIAGRDTEGFEVHRASPVAGEPDSTWTFWVDPDTQLPVQIEILADGKKQAGVLRDIRFDVPMDDALFSMTIPTGYKVIDTGGVTMLRAAATTQEAANMTLTPLVGIGPVHFYDSREKIIAAFGQPDKMNGKVTMEYYSLGFGVVTDEKHGLLYISCHAKQTAFFVMNGFAGKTDKGIAIGASRAEIEAAYGKDEIVRDGDGTTTLEYPDLKLQFSLDRDKVTHITLDRPPPPAN